MASRNRSVSIQNDLSALMKTLAQQDGGLLHSSLKAQLSFHATSVNFSIIKYGCVCIFDKPEMVVRLKCLAMRRWFGLTE
jgi:hypothetical protein